jgi:hypothetical protein
MTHDDPMTEIAVLRERVAGLQGRVDALQNTIATIEASIAARLTRIETKIDDLVTSRSQQVGVMTVFHWIWMGIGPVLGALAGWLFNMSARH